ncbi:Serine phosphatase RsbU, regulator of sigma subunit [Nocardioides terrae]|uniref:Serine phosphatase RsbU, regulator of sigma subunit n=1 Tax=Nocardioides terrae TaxID=574651 RepID=A0A1I1L643_9ACTN|nr:SpoIIE family protein phosphatase [Nocardioides terrae]SFC68527.1 Serine phosphatase RsbU, regulator of sigma subunit [Nocardioides terrae]
MTSMYPLPADHTRDEPLIWGGQEPVVLLVEDDPGDALLVEELVADCRPGMKLQWARSMAAAREALAGAIPDCILLDLHLPDSHGMDALTAIKEWSDGVAVVVLTGLAEEDSGLAAVAAGAQDYLVKGRVDAEWLSRAVRYAMQRKQTEQSAVALQASQLLARENARLERGLLPKPLLNGGRGLRVASRYHPGRAQALLGGDFYDVVECADGSVEMLIGDVSGHGPDEAAVGVALRIAWRTLVLSGVDPSERLRRLDEILAAERPEEHIFATLSCVSLSPDRRHARVVRAGHPGLMLRSGGCTEWIEVEGGPALGILPDAEWPEHELVLPADGWELVLFTDGLFEGHSGAGADRLGEDGLLAMARRIGTADAQEFVDALIGGAQEAAATHGGLDDDVAVLAMQWSPA